MLLERHLPGLVEDLRRAVELASRTSRLSESALTDPLTGLPNRRMLGRVLGRTRAGQHVVIIDLDNFKQLNDEHGHAEGDEVLRAFGRVLNTTMRDTDVAGRFGGEEFAVVLPCDADPVGLLERLRGEWERARPWPVTFSAGIARVTSDAGAAMVAADRALYEAKHAGRDRWHSAETETERPARQPIPPAPASRGYVDFREVRLHEGERSHPVQAVRGHLGEVEGAAGFRGLQIWGDDAEPATVVIVSWWDSREAFDAHLRSPGHRRPQVGGRGVDRPEVRPARGFRPVVT